ncbi:MAG: hypothetical protein E5V75_05085 [Mesorhizobium sp.]|nr:MAG: hypothetical protein E5V75_05085 [Mesorhizobium sp.]
MTDRLGHVVGPNIGLDRDGPRAGARAGKMESCVKRVFVLVLHVSAKGNIADHEASANEIAIGDWLLLSRVPVHIVLFVEIKPRSRPKSTGLDNPVPVRTVQRFPVLIYRRNSSHDHAALVIGKNEEELSPDIYIVEILGIGKPMRSHSDWRRGDTA